MNLLLVEPDEVSLHGTVTLRDGRANHLRRVLKVDVGAIVRVGIIDGPVGTAAVEALNGEAIELRCTLDPTAVPARPPVDLLLAVPRPKVLRRLWPQLAALGVGRIMLTNAARVERNYFDTHLLAESVYRPLLIEGLQQARDTRLPIVSVHKQLKVFLEDDLPAAPDTLRVYADPGGSLDMETAIASRDMPQVLVAVGPEGGWTDYERRMLQAHSFVAVAMGPRTLRSDTACIALLALAHAGVRLCAERTGR